MGARRIATIALSGALVVGGAGAAIAAVTKDDGKKAEQGILDDAAKRLNVTPEQLRDALSAAEDAQLDQAVKDGKLTQKQADAIKQARKQSGRVLGPVGPPMLQRHFRGGPGMLAMRHGLIDDVAKALGTTPQKLIASLRDGKTLAAIAKANGTSLADVRAAVKASVKERLDKAVKDGDLTQKQADAILARLDDHLKRIGSGRPLRLERHFRGGPGMPPMPPGMPPDIRPGSMMPGEDAPELMMPPGGTYS